MFYFVHYYKIFYINNMLYIFYLTKMIQGTCNRSRLG